MNARVLVVLVVLGLAAGVVYSGREVVVPQARMLRDFPAMLQNWRSVGQVSFDERTLAVLRPSDYLMRQYRNSDGQDLFLYVGYHSGGKDVGPIHSPRNCLPGSGWMELDSGKMTVNTPSGAVHLVRATYAKGDEGSVYYYWYQMRDETLTEDWELKVSELWNSLVDKRKDAAFIRISVPLAQEKNSDKVVETFIINMYPVLRKFLPS